MKRSPHSFSPSSRSRNSRTGGVAPIHATRNDLFTEGNHFQRVLENAQGEGSNRPHVIHECGMTTG